MSWRKLTNALAALTLAACSQHELARPAAPLSQPTRLCSAAAAPPSCRSAAEARQLLAEDLELLGMADTPSGLQGAKILTLEGELDDRPVTFRARWRAQGSAGLINEPRKELAAYAVQRLFLDDDELVVPPTAAYCFPLEDYRRFAPNEKPSFEGINCVLGFLTLWLEGVKTVSSAREAGWLGERSGAGLWDPQLFERDATYRDSIASCNLLMHLINHGDAHEQQLLFERTPRGLRSYVVDNSISFLSIKNPMLLVREDWSSIQVPSLPERTIARLKALTPRDLERLATVQQLELDDGELEPLAPVGEEPAGELAPSHDSEMSWHGKRLRIGLTRAEIDLVSSRLRALVSRPDLGKLTGAR